MQIRDTVNVFQCSDMQDAKFARMYGVRDWAEYLDTRGRNNHLLRSHHYTVLVFAVFAFFCAFLEFAFLGARCRWRLA
jgi:hypothetical protein